MRSRLAAIRTAWLPLLLATLLLAPTIVTNSAEGRVRLGSDVLKRSRGNNLNQALTLGSCSNNTGNEGCTFNGQLCLICEMEGYSTTMTAPGGGYNLGS
jgi:hypothetical protein